VPAPHAQGSRGRRGDEPLRRCAPAPLGRGAEGDVETNPSGAARQLPLAGEPWEKGCACAKVKTSAAPAGFKPPPGAETGPSPQRENRNEKKVPRAHSVRARGTEARSESSPLQAGACAYSVRARGTEARSESSPLQAGACAHSVRARGTECMERKQSAAGRRLLSVRLGCRVRRGIRARGCDVRWREGPAG